MQRHSFDYSKNEKYNLSVKSFDDFRTTALQNILSPGESYRERLDSPFKRICKQSPTNRNSCSSRDTQYLPSPDNKLHVRSIFPRDMRRSRSPRKASLKSPHSGIFHRSRKRNIVSTSLLNSSCSLSPFADFESP